MRFGYMPSFNMDLLDEIEFAKKYFDFIEITLKQDLTQYDHKYLKKIRSVLNKFELLGHIHWETDLTKPEEIEKAFNYIEIYDFLGSKKITIHPSSIKNLTSKEIQTRNYQALSKIANFCREKPLQLLVENTTASPFNQVENLKYLLDKIPSLGITLDIGHAKHNWVEYLKLSDKIKHIHLHHSYEKNDHLSFFNDQVLKKILIRLSQLEKDLTISLEIFRTLKYQKATPIDGEQRREIILEQLEIMKKADPVKGSAT